MALPLTIRQLTEHLARYVERFPDAHVRINGEHLERLTIVVQNPLKRVRREGVMHHEHDDSRPRVIDILANGREGEALPIVTLDVEMGPKDG